MFSFLDKELEDFTIMVPLGKSVDLSCTLEKSKGSLVAVKWKHGLRQILHHDASFKEVAKAKYTSTITCDDSIVRLNISIVGHADDGEYSCVSFFQNGIGKRNSWILQVEGKPSPIKLKEYSETVLTGLKQLFG